MLLHLHFTQCYYNVIITQCSSFYTILLQIHYYAMVLQHHYYAMLLGLHFTQCYYIFIFHDVITLLLLRNVIRPTFYTLILYPLFAQLEPDALILN